MMKALDCLSMNFVAIGSKELSFLRDRLGSRQYQVIQHWQRWGAYFFAYFSYALRAHVFCMFIHTEYFCCKFCIYM